MDWSLNVTHKGAHPETAVEEKAGCGVGKIVTVAVAVTDEAQLSVTVTVYVTELAGDACGF